MGWLSILGNLVARCRRTACSLGFGVQSPSAYRFVRYVAGETWPYYAYDALDRAALGLTTERERHRFRFYLRLANHVQPLTIVECVDPLTPVRETYLRAGCHTAAIQRCADADAVASLSFSSPILVRMPAERRWMPLFDALSAQAGAATVLVVEGIGSNAGARALWQEIIGDPRTGVAYDLEDCGVVMYDPGKYKRIYRARL